RSPVTTPHSFDIIPADPQDAIDLLLFDGAVPDISTKIPRQDAAPVWSNISRAATSLNSTGGLCPDATEDYVRSGVGSAYSRAIDVQEGDLYYLLIDYPQRPRAGFTLHFHYDPPPPPPAPVDVPPQALVVEVLDAVSGAAVDAAITIEG